MKTIAIILPYFGPFPNYFRFWLESCIKNSTIDFYIFTDNVLDEILPPNIKLTNIRFEQVKLKFQKLFDFQICLDIPYKLCDFRPFYGQAFSEYVKEYDFWGYCDCDMIFGNIRKFLDENILLQNSYILALGHFHLQKTNDHLYAKALEIAKSKEGYNYKHILSSSKSFTFDELPSGLPAAYNELNSVSFFSGFFPQFRIYDSLSNQYPNFIDVYNFAYELGNKYKKSMYYTFPESKTVWRRELDKTELKKNAIYEYNHGTLNRVFYNKETKKVEKCELLYAHFYKRKLRVKTNNLESYLIVPNVIIEYKKVVTKNELFYYNIFRSSFSFRLNNLRIKLSNKIKSSF